MVRYSASGGVKSFANIYNGFELVEYEPIPGKEEYFNSDKYELKVREGHDLEWGGVRLRIDQQEDPALLFRCFT